MGNLVRTARGQLIDFELLAIKQQLASAPVPRVVEQRKQAIDIKDGTKPAPSVDLDMLAVSEEAAELSAKGTQLKKK